MTVCVAAISQYINNPTIVFATDHMMTSGDLTYEGIQGKYFFLNRNNSAVALSAGDASDALIVSRRTRTMVDTENLEGLTQIAERFAEQYRDYRREIFAREFLNPHGFNNFEEYNQLHGTLSRELTSTIDRNLRENYLPISAREFGGAIIVAGVDAVSRSDMPGYLTAHIFTVRDPGQVVCEDEVGFAAVGSGARQAQTYLMLQRYKQDASFAEATLSVYSAKRQAENAPYVGPQTALVRVDSTGYGLAQEPEIQGFEKIYQQTLTDQENAAKRARHRVAAFLDGLTSTRAEEREAQEQGVEPGPVR
jgi:hypothetical protein